MKRREFIILTSVGAASTTLLSACGHPENKIIPVLVPDEEYVPGIDYWKASACAMCPAGCGILVRTREHMANKIEGNPLHPVNEGALCARGQAGLQMLYNPDRIKGPMKRAGERGSGQFEEIDWDEAINAAAGKLSDIKAAGRADTVIFATSDGGGVTGLAAEIFGSNYGARLLDAAGRHVGALADAYAKAYGRGAAPIFDIGNSTYLLSFGARFLETWQSPVMYSAAYGRFRHAADRRRGRFVQFEPRMSLTAANADEWLPAASGSEGLIALAIAQVILREGLIKGAPAPDFLSDPIEDYAPEKVADQSGIPAEEIVRIAREFAAAERPLALGGAGAVTARERQNLLAVNFLNTLAGNLNKPGGVLLPEHDTFDPLGQLRGGSRPGWLSSIESAIKASSPQALLIHHVNPAYFTPAAKQELNAVPFIISFSSFMDETTEMADLILPDHSYLESWDIKSASLAGPRAAVTIVQPVVKPESNTRQTADVLLTLSQKLGGSSPPGFESAEDMVKQAVANLPKAATAGPAARAESRAGGDSSEDGESSEDSFETFAERGVWVGEIKGERRAIAQTETRFSLLPASGAASSDEYPLTLLAYEHATLGLGEFANLPWLQELPDPMTSVMWGSWVEINPRTAASLGIKDGDLVEISSPQTTLRAAAVVYPAIRPDVIAIPCGQGHTAHGRYAKGRGANVAQFMPAADSGQEVVRVKASKVAGDARLIRFGTELLEHMETKR
ncbi:MAG: molybdopterin-dependent oxidoreductase [Blastocatellia bacterium]